jgi:hypothetical protein
VIGQPCPVVSGDDICIAQLERIVSAALSSSNEAVEDAPRSGRRPEPEDVGSTLAVAIDFENV